MKKLIALIVIFVTSLSVTAQSEDSLVRFNPAKLDLGKIQHGQPVTSYVMVVNISKFPVVVERVWGSCGCTIPD